MTETYRNQDRQLHLNAFLMTHGHHEASWRLPESDPDAATSLAHYVRLAQIAERGLLDSVFFADIPSLEYDLGRRAPEGLEPATLLAALAASTKKVGLIASASTTYNSPYNLARRFSSVDHLSRGRAGWNIVTTGSLAASHNYGWETPPAHAERYERAQEFLEVVKALWSGWDPDAVVGDKEEGVWADAQRVRAAEHRGKFYSVQGPLILPRSPQGYPFLVQAGSSEAGRDFAAEHAEGIFTAHQHLDTAQEFYQDIKQRAGRAGRRPEHVLVLPGIVPVIGGTEEEARRRDQELNSLIRPEYAIRSLATLLSVEESDLVLDEPLPQNLPEENQVEGWRSRRTLVVQLGRRENLTVRQIIARLGGGRGHRTFPGTPEQIADTIQAWFEEGAADGFNIMPPAFPSGLEDFVDQVVPLLQERGLFRTEYTAETLRGHYGLPEPIETPTRRPTKEVVA